MKFEKKLYAILIACVLVGTLITSIFAASSFTDVPEDAYYAEAADRMAEANILSGFGDGRFYGDWELTRAQFAALACKLLGKVDEAVSLAGKTQFADVPETHWSTGYINYTVANKIINGDGDGNFRPDDPVKYEEAIKVIVCLLLPDKTIVVDPTDWSKNFIEEADKLGITDNLIGKKGEYMKRSDIAVIADAAYFVLNNNEETVTTTTKKNTGTGTGTGNKPVVTTVTTTEKVTDPTETTSAEVTKTPDVTVTLAPVVVSTEPLVTNAPRPNETPDL